MAISLVISGVLIIIAYLLGSTPTGYLAGKYLQRIDIREHGSGSTGATNVLRTIGKKAAIAVLAIDLLKGSIAVLLVKIVYASAISEVLPITWQPWLITITALAAVIGHSKSVWLNFSGGKSVATSLGVLLVMNLVVALGTLAAFGVMLTISRIVSLSSITGAIAVILLMILFQQPTPYIIFAGLCGVYVIFRHQGNIRRLLAGTEPKIGQKLPENA
ncbi:MAG: glycerol-3-phosphate 1-O-acyltransferase PlsY [Xenococcaceae cyanobacterium MO_188.B32]|nr:glycerol-3-phosphate 1-O-acyltransferase PlsY [Xenococcaceae cyanobacterium MO_188.B32]